MLFVCSCVCILTYSDIHFGKTQMKEDVSLGTQVCNG